MGARLFAGAKWARFAFEGTCRVGRGLIFLVIQVQAASGECTVLTSDSRGEVPQAVRLQVQAVTSAFGHAHAGSSKSRRKV